MTFIEKLNDYKEKGLLMNQFHPTLPLIIWNYSTSCQYSGAWDSITLQCRGLVTDTDGNIVSRGFSKFFNIEEERHEATDDFEIFEKLDGQYIGCFWFNGEMIVNSKGSFTSPYAIEARRILEENHLSFIQRTNYKTTYCFELVGFEQIVVSYPETNLIMTGMFTIDEECPITWVKEEHFEIPIVQKFKGLDWENIKQLNWSNSEGFVVRFSNGQRCKIKFEDYIKLHRQMTNLTTRSIWKALSEGEPVSSILNDVPDEFYDKVHEYEKLLKNNYADLEWDIKSRFAIELKAKRNLEDLHGFTELESRKMFAENVAKYPHKSVLFAMLDGKDYSKIIWKLIKPKFEKL